MPSISFFPNENSENRWTDHMKHSYTYSSDDDILPCVFQVPDNLREIKADAYVPQVVGLGPYHHFRPEVQFMESKKRAVVKDYLQVVDFKDFIDLVEKSPQEFEHVIRSCYDRFLNLNKRTLSWIAIVDGIFLLHFIQKRDPDMYSKLNLEKFVADVLMLENQIPIVLLLKARVVLLLEPCDSTSPVLVNEFYQFCEEYSPLKLTSDPVRKSNAFDNNNHMLHFMYQLIMQNNADDNQGQSADHDNRDEGINSIRPLPSVLMEGCRIKVNAIADFGGEILGHTIEEFNSALVLAQNAGLKVPGNVIKISQILRSLERTFQLQNHKEALWADKIEIPSVSRLIAILNIKFRRLDDGQGIGNIALDPNKNEFLLPVITLRPNSEAILRNLVAYEATATTEQLGVGPTKLRDYVDLMCGLIKTDKDVQHLRNANIIQGGLADQEIVKMCNGIKKSEEKPHEESKVHGSVKDVNDMYGKSRFVKSFRWVAKKFADLHYVLKSNFPIMVLLLLAIQSGCQIFDCRVSRNGAGTSSQNIFWPDYQDLGSEAKVMLPRKVLRYF